MKVLDLFSGIGGFSLGLERAGMETIAFCEIEDYPVSVLNKHWPDVPVHGDIRKLDGKQYRGTIELICGGFPCQPFSVAGKQAGEADDRHLWPEMYRVIQEVRPNWVIGENVAGFIKMALDDVLSDLEGEGYTCQTFVIPACAVGGIHRRDRVWIIANTEGERCREAGIYCGRSEERPTRSRDSRAISNTEHDGTLATSQSGSEGSAILNDPKGSNQTGESERVCPASDVADTIDQRLQGGEQREAYSEGARASRPDAECCNAAHEFRPIPIPTESPVRRRDDGLPDNMARLKALGNSVVPQIPELIGRAIMEVNSDKYAQ